MDYFVFSYPCRMRVSIFSVGDVDRRAPLGRILSFGDLPGKPSLLEKNPSVIFLNVFLSLLCSMTRDL